MIDTFWKTSKHKSSMNIDDEMMGPYFPQSSNAPSGSTTLYAPTVPHHNHTPSTVSPAVSSAYYSNSHMATAYNQPQYWNSMQQPSHQTNFSYPQYSLPTATPAPVQMMPSSSPQFLDQTAYTSRSSSTSSAGTYPIAVTEGFTSPSYTRSVSPSSPDLRAYGYQNKNGTWTCAYPGCTSKAVFTRGCDLRKHHKRHTKSYFCSFEGCPQSTGGGFSSKKDLARHMASHQPSIICEWDGCDRVFSRVDNMRDHVKRIHMKGSRGDSNKRLSSH